MSKEDIKDKENSGSSQKSDPSKQNQKNDVVDKAEEQSTKEKAGVVQRADLRSAAPTKPLKSPNGKKDIDESGEKSERRSFISQSGGRQSGQKSWYVIHTYSGYEDQVAESLKQRIDSFHMKDKIFDVIVPKEKQVEIKNGKKKIVEKRIFPGYVLVDMIVTDESWFVVRNTPNVTGFIGFGVRPTPMSDKEISAIKKRMGVKDPKYKMDLKVDDLVRIGDGPLKGFEGKVGDIDEEKGKIKVLVSMFGRETPMTLDYLQVKKI